MTSAAVASAALLRNPRWRGMIKPGRKCEGDPDEWQRAALSLSLSVYGDYYFNRAACVNVFTAKILVGF